MKVHHLNCGTLCPAGGKYLVEGMHILGRTFKSFQKIKGDSKSLNVLKDAWQRLNPFVQNIFNIGSDSIPFCMGCHCLLIESSSGLILVDTGFGLEDIKNTNTRIPPEFLYFFGGPLLDKKETAAYQIRKLGFKREDVRHIIVSHMDVDHVGGMRDFPKAQIHLHQDEFEAANNPQSFTETQRYIKAMWSHHPRWNIYQPKTGSHWKGFTCVRNLKGLPPEILLIPLRGHTKGHTGVAIKTQTGYLFFTGDAYLRREQIESTQCSSIPSYVKIYNQFMHEDKVSFEQNISKLKVLKKNEQDKIEIICSHDLRELKRIQAQ